MLHELGHAVAARRTGAQAEISLNFLAGYASYVPSRPLTRAEQIGISFAGPGIQIAVSVAMLLALGANPLEQPSYANDPALLAIWWAGPIIGVFNLVPVLPLDGGNIVTTALDRIVPDRAERPMIWFSLAVTGAFTVFAFIDTRYRGFMLIMGFLLVSQLQMLGSSKPVTSPWHDADEALAAGKPGQGAPDPGVRAQPPPPRPAAPSRHAVDRTDGGADRPAPRTPGRRATRGTSTSSPTN